jgi:hypothetical protein
MASARQCDPRWSPTSPDARAHWLRHTHANVAVAHIVMSCLSLGQSIAIPLFKKQCVWSGGGRL